MANTENGISEKEHLNNIRGDTIGDTAYSEGFVLNALIHLIAVENLDADSLDKFIENELCVIWDMTTEKDVSEFLLGQSAMQIFCDVLEMNYSPRLTEVIIGTMANMCSHPGAIQEVNTNEAIRKCVYNFLSCDDSLIIVQVMRFIFSNIYYNSTLLESWLNFLSENNFSSKIQFILTNSTNGSVLSNTFETINCICSTITEVADKHIFKSMFVNRDLVMATVVGFEELSKCSFDSHREQSMERCEIVFLSIHSVLTAFEISSLSAYKDHLPDILKIINNIITKYIEVNNEAIIDVVEYVTASLPILHDANLQESRDISKNMLKLWRDSNSEINNACDSSFDENPNVNNELQNLLPQYFVRVFKLLSKDELKLLLQDLDKKELKDLSDKIKELIDLKKIHSYYSNVITITESLLSSS